jgi:ADP-ribose pyrophosphatase
MKKWKTIKTEDVSPSKWFPIERHTVELPNGKIVDDYFMSSLGNVVMIVPVTVNNEIILVKQYKHAADEILIELPAGYQQKNKTLEESALAELEEETGIRTTPGNLILLSKTVTNPTKIASTTYCYLARNLEFNSKQKFDETEDIEIVKVSAKKALDMVLSGEIWVADSVVNILKASITYPELFK